MKPPFSRIGGKTKLKKIIIPRIPEHDVYIEPFIGGGAIYLDKPVCKTEVVNDLDTDLINAWKELKITTNEDLTKYDTIDMSILNEYYNSKETTGIPFLLKQIIRSRNTFGAMGKGKLYKNYTPYGVLKYKKDYENRLKDTILLNKNYIDVINEYDCEKAFFYLDPPYEKSDKLYKHGTFDFEELCDTLKKIKGKFLLSLNNSDYITELFKDFNIADINVFDTTNLYNRGKKVLRKEVLISNY